MTMSQGNNEVRPTGEEAGEFIEEDPEFTDAGLDVLHVEAAGTASAIGETKEFRMVADGPAGKVEERVTQAGSTSREELANVGQTVQEQGRDVAQQAKEQAQSAMHRMADDVRSQAETQASNLSQSMHAASGQMHAMADAGDPSSFATTLVREGADAAERLASRLDSGGVDGALAEVRSFARRSPGVFLFGAAAAGFVAGRLVRNLASSSNGLSQAFQSNGQERNPMYPAEELDLQAAGFVEGTDIRGGIG